MKLYNTLTRKKEDFKPLKDNVVKLYTCGLTVYSQPHIGNWVAYIYWDILVRTLIASGYSVTRVQNITDVGHLTSDEDAGEDKMLVSALKEGKTAWEVADKYIRIADHEAFDILGLHKPDHMPRATDLIPQQINFVQQLEEKGFVYQISDGLYFDTSKLSDYGKLARLDIDGLRFGARVADTGKKNPTDFAVWKFSKPEEKRDMEWESPWGVGFPGWHLECSVIAREYLGDQIDIHTGGIEHIPVHHTNEIAQTEAVTGRPFATFWLHANHLKVNGTKISKSLGNIYTLQDIFNKGYDLRAFKLFVLSKHYQTEGNFTWEILEAAQNRLNNWQATADLRWQVKQDTSNNEPTNHETGHQEEQIIATSQRLLLALQDNLDTPLALAIIDELFTAIAKDGLEPTSETSFHKLLEDIQTLLGINLIKDDVDESIKQLLHARETARMSKKWDEADKLRSALVAKNIGIRDSHYGTIWYRL